MYNPFLITDRPFLGQPNEALLVLKDLQPNRPDKATYLTNHKKTVLAIFKNKKNYWASLW